MNDAIGMNVICSDCGGLQGSGLLFVYGSSETSQKGPLVRLIRCDNIIDGFCCVMVTTVLFM
jgi:hypothetical protein